MVEILHHFETMGNHCPFLFPGESSFQGFLGGAGFRPSTVGDGQKHPISPSLPISKPIFGTCEEMDGTMRTKIDHGDL